MILVLGRNSAFGFRTSFSVRAAISVRVETVRVFRYEFSVRVSVRVARYELRRFELACVRSGARILRNPDTATTPTIVSQVVNA